jgi:hypothetical protein
MGRVIVLRRLAVVRMIVPGNANAGRGTGMCMMRAAACRRVPKHRHGSQ